MYEKKRQYKCREKETTNDPPFPPPPRGVFIIEDNIIEYV
jgi:hypothetical protein